MKPPRSLRSLPPEGAEGRGSKPTCVGLDGQKSGCLWHPRGLQGIQWLRAAGRHWMGQA